MDSKITIRATVTLRLDAGRIADIIIAGMLPGKILEEQFADSLAVVCESKAKILDYVRDAVGLAVGLIQHPAPDCVRALENRAAYSRWKRATWEEWRQHLVGIVSAKLEEAEKISDTV
jgi:hypothetical protein